MKIDDELPPPRPLSLQARQVWDRNARKLYDSGRFGAIDLELLCVFSETLVLYEQFRDDVNTHGTLVTGRSAQERVRNPSLIGLAQCRTDLIRLSRAIPLVDVKHQSDGSDIDAYIDELMASE